MKIIILGAGQVGASVARTGIGSNDITLVDTSAEHLRNPARPARMRTVRGTRRRRACCAKPARTMPTLIAVTQSTRRSVARARREERCSTCRRDRPLRSTDFVDHPELLSRRTSPSIFDLPLADRDRLHQAADRLSEALQVLEFARVSSA